MEPSIVAKPVSTLADLKQLVIQITKSKIAPEQVSDSANLFDDLGLDSTSVVDLVLALEEHYEIEVADDQLEIELFENISNLAVFIERLQSQSPSQIAV